MAWIWTDELIRGLIAEGVEPAPEIRRLVDTPIAVRLEYGSDTAHSLAQPLGLDASTGTAFARTMDVQAPLCPCEEANRMAAARSVG